MNKYYLMYPSGSVDDFMFTDADQLTYIDTKSRAPRNFFSKAIKKIHLSRKLNAIVPLPFRKKWYDFKDLGKDPNANYYCFILASSFLHIDAHLIKKMFNKDNMHLRLILVPILINI